MSPPERLPPDDPREWLNRARSNLVRARHRDADVYLEDLCFDAQQAGAEAVVPEAVRQAGELTPYAVLTRYPGTVRPVSEREYRRAVKIAGTVVRWAEEQL